METVILRLIFFRQVSTDYGHLNKVAIFLKFEFIDWVPSLLVLTFKLKMLK